MTNLCVSKLLVKEKGSFKRTQDDESQKLLYVGLQNIRKGERFLLQFLRIMKVRRQHDSETSMRRNNLHMENNSAMEN